jgi:hypothetical protein
MRTLTQAYARAEHAAAYLAELDLILDTRHDSLASLNEATISFLSKGLQITSETIRASTLNVAGHRNELLVRICKAVAADTYLIGQGGGLSHTDEEYFGTNGISIRRQGFSHPVYRQLHGEFAAGLSALDLLLNEGPAAAALVRATIPD